MPCTSWLAYYLCFFSFSVIFLTLLSLSHCGDESICGGADMSGSRASRAESARRRGIRSWAGQPPEEEEEGELPLPVPAECPVDAAEGSTEASCPRPNVAPSQCVSVRIGMLWSVCDRRSWAGCDCERCRARQCGKGKKKRRKSLTSSGLSAIVPELRPNIM